MPSATGFRTAVSVDGTAVSGFFLQRRDDGRFAFTRLSADAPGAATFAASTTTARVGQWYHLVGVYDQVGGTLRLFVNGTLQQTVPFTSPWRATGPGPCRRAPRTTARSSGPPARARSARRPSR